MGGANSGRSSSSSSDASGSPEVRRHGGPGVGSSLEVGSSSEADNAVWSDPCSFATHVAVGPSRIHGCGLIATMDIEYAALGGKQSWGDVTSGTVLVLTLPIPDQIAAEHYCSFMEKNHVPDPAIFLPSLGGRVVPLCVSRRGKISKSPLWYMNSSSSPATANAAVLHKVVGDECKIVVEVRKTVLKGQELTWFYGGRWLQQQGAEGQNSC